MRAEQGLCAGPRAGKAQEPADSGSTGRKPLARWSDSAYKHTWPGVPVRTAPGPGSSARRGEPGVVTVAGCAAQSGARTEDRGCVRVGEGPPDGGGGKKEGCL